MTETGNRLVEPALLPECTAEIAVGQDVAGPQFQGALETSDRLVQLALALQDEAQVVVGRGIARVQFQGAAVARHCVWKLGQGAVRFPQVVVEGSHTWFFTDRAFDALDCGVVPAHLVRDHADKVERVGMVRLDREDFAIDLFGGLQPAGLVVPDCKRQSFRNGCHSAIIAAPPAGRKDLPTRVCPRGNHVTGSQSNASNAQQASRNRFPARLDRLVPPGLDSLLHDIVIPVALDRLARPMGMDLLDIQFRLEKAFDMKAHQCSTISAA